MSKAYQDLVEMERYLVTLPRDRYERVKQCTNALATVYVSYEEDVAAIAIAIIGLMMQAGIEENGE